jgi:hypothetical protein
MELEMHETTSEKQAKACYTASQELEKARAAGDAHSALSILQRLREMIRELDADADTEAPDDHKLSPYAFCLGHLDVSLREGDFKRAEAALLSIQFMLLEATGDPIVLRVLETLLGNRGWIDCVSAGYSPTLAVLRILKLTSK